MKLTKLPKYKASPGQNWRHHKGDLDLWFAFWLIDRNDHARRKTLVWKSLTGKALRMASQVVDFRADWEYQQLLAQLDSIFMPDIAVAEPIFRNMKQSAKEPLLLYIANKREAFLDAFPINPDEKVLIQETILGMCRREMRRVLMYESITTFAALKERALQVQAAELFLIMNGDLDNTSLDGLYPVQPSNRQYLDNWAAQNRKKRPIVHH